MPQIGIRFGGATPPYRTRSVVFDDDHVLDVEFGAEGRMRTITVVDAARYLPPASALGHRGAYRLVMDAEKDMACIEFRPGAATSGGHVRDAIDIDGEDALQLLWGPAEELEAIVILNASRRLPQPSPAGSYRLANVDALLVKLHAGDEAPVAMRGGEVTFPSGMRVILMLDDQGRLWSATVVDASQWLSPATLEAAGVQLGVLPVGDEPDTVFLEVAGGRAEETMATERLSVEGLEMSAAYDSSDRLLGFVVREASQKLPAPFDRVTGVQEDTGE